MIVADAPPTLGSPKLAELRTHDATHGTAYVRTLAAYLEAFGDTAATARRLGVHENTVRYRIRRMASLAGVDLADPAERLLLAVELGGPAAAKPHPGVAVLVAYDVAHRTPYVETLLAYLDCFGDVTATSQRVHVHVRTCRYRLRRIARLSGIRLDDPAERLAVHLELRLPR